MRPSDDAVAYHQGREFLWLRGGDRIVEVPERLLKVHRTPLGRSRDGKADAGDAVGDTNCPRAARVVTRRD